MNFVPVKYRFCDAQKPNSGAVFVSLRHMRARFPRESLHISKGIESNVNIPSYGTICSTKHSVNAINNGVFVRDIHGLDLLLNLLTVKKTKVPFFTIPIGRYGIFKYLLHTCRQRVSITFKNLYCTNWTNIYP